MTQQESEVIIGRLKVEKAEAVSASMEMRMKEERELDEKFETTMSDIRVRKTTLMEKLVGLQDKCHDKRGTDEYLPIRMEQEMIRGNLEELRAEESRINRDYRRNRKNLDFEHRSRVNVANVHYREKLCEVMNEVVQSKKMAV